MLAAWESVDSEGVVSRPNWIPEKILPQSRLSSTPSLLVIFARVGHHNPTVLGHRFVALAHLKQHLSWRVQSGCATYTRRTPGASCPSRLQSPREVLFEMHRRLSVPRCRAPPKEARPLRTRARARRRRGMALTEKEGAVVGAEAGQRARVY